MDSWRRGLVAAGVLAWMAVLVLGAWPPNVRPAFLDVAHAGAVTTLRLFGMSAGQPLFQTDASPWKQHGFCFHLREGESGRVLFPPGGECRIRGFHPRLPPVGRATHRMLASAWKLHEGDARQVAASRGYLEAIGRSFCLAREGETSGGAGRLEGLWIWYYLHYDDGRVAHRNGLLFDYACDSGELGSVTWNPSDAEVLSRWGEPPS